MLTTSTRDETGLVVLEVPDDAIVDRGDRLILANPQLVRYGDRHVRLTPTQHAILRFVSSNGPSDFEAVIDAVWIGKTVSDSCVRSVCSRASILFVEAGIPYSLTTRGGCVALERLDGNP